MDDVYFLSISNFHQTKTKNNLAFKQKKAFFSPFGLKSINNVIKIAESGFNLTLPELLNSDSHDMKTTLKVIDFFLYRLFIFRRYLFFIVILQKFALKFYLTLLPGRVL